MLTSLSSLVLTPNNCASKPGTNVFDPNTKSNEEASPPSNASPSTNPLKSITTVSPFSAA